MCFEFEYLYWARLEEEARQMEEEEESRKAAARAAKPATPHPEQSQPIPV